MDIKAFLKKWCIPDTKDEGILDQFYQDLNNLKD